MRPRAGWQLPHSNNGRFRGRGAPVVPHSHLLLDVARMAMHAVPTAR